ncbi:EF-hand calcium-binding domain-containing protein 1 [Agrilus planipennis]|uniref:EF-hand calcium-binding domain-containing protein 1 n=1 Tax=Agrilus planipennis TaxID=224129 RepID=A0A1W4WRE0_AGRPL|nr:EF-hand calcium-binding domain-containing protein 1 [Agrilus planipennis]
MSTSVNKSPGLHHRKGACLLKSVSVFLNIARNAKARSVTSTTRVAPKKQKMTSKEYKCPSKVLDIVKRSSAFSRSETETLYKIYKQLISVNRPAQIVDRSLGSTASINKLSINEGIDRTLFRELLHNTFDLITEDTLMDRIFCVWDKMNVGLLTFDAFFNGLVLFLKGNENEKIEFCFAVYDLNSDGYIVKDEMFQLLKNCLIKHPQDEDPDEGVKDLVELIMKKLDKDKDGKVSLDDFKGSVVEDNLLLQAFGKCLPDERVCDTFLLTI